MLYPAELRAHTADYSKIRVSVMRNQFAQVAFSQPGSPATGLRRWGGSKSHPVHFHQQHGNSDFALAKQRDRATPYCTAKCSNIQTVFTRKETSCEPFSPSATRPTPPGTSSNCFSSIVSKCWLTHAPPPIPATLLTSIARRCAT